VPAETASDIPSSAGRPELHTGMRASDPATSILSWRRSSRCSSHSCVEVAVLAEGGAAIRDSKAGADGPILVFSGDEWREFVSGMKAGDFD
jgi:Domain of unknown function (DUF397)